MATSTLHRLPDAEPIDPYACVLQASGLLHILRRNIGGEVRPEDRASAEDMLHSIEMASCLVNEGLKARPENVTASGGQPLNDGAKAILQRTQASLRLISAAAFIQANDSMNGKIEQALSDSVLVNALWAASDMLDKAEAETS